METKECIMGRRSIRKFKDTPVSKETIEELVSLAAYGPTWKNCQANRFIAITDKETKSKIAQLGTLGYDGNTRIIEGAPLIMVMTIVQKRSGYERDGSFSTSKGTHWESFDAGIVTQTMCLAAHAMGLGSVIMGIIDEDKISGIITIPEGETVSAVVAIGYPDEEPDAPKRKELDKILRFL
ncbi:MAG: nitroreductase family protein [Butyrivibrio sp.]|nr:nitroreductase family protein [Butyrivibrio sp.]